MFRKEQDSIVLVLTVVESDITNENKTSLCSVFLIFFPSNEEDCSFLYLVLPIQSWMALRYLTVSSQHWWKASRARAQQTVWTTTKRQPPFLSAPSSSSYSSPRATKGTVQPRLLAEAGPSAALGWKPLLLAVGSAQSLCETSIPLTLRSVLNWMSKCPPFSVCK